MQAGAGRSCDDISPLQGPGVDGHWGGVRGLPTVTWISASSSSSLLGNLGQQQCHSKLLPSAWIPFAREGLRGTFKVGALRRMDLDL